jgi:hypothetical protein
LGSDGTTVLSYAKNTSGAFDDVYIGNLSHDAYLNGRDIYIKSNDNISVFCDSTGDVAIGTTSLNSGSRLTINGVCAATSFKNTSDIRLKDI